MPGGRVFITGASGFVGSAIIDELLGRNFSVTVLLHHKSLDARITAQIRIVKGDLFDDGALDEGIRGADAIIHVVGIIMERPMAGVTFQRIHFEGAKKVIDAAKRNGVKRFVHMSALGSRPDAVSNYHKTKFAAEEYLRASSLEWTIFRPSLIHGPRGEFMHMEAKWARMRSPPFLFMPYFGAGVLGLGGAGKLQPVFVGDVGRAFVDALEKRRTIGEVYPLAGPDVVSWPELHRICSKAIVGRRRFVMPIPVWSARIQAALLPSRLLGFNRDQVIMSQEDNTADVTKFREDFGWDPQPFEATLESYAGRL